jgi:hypothetical protein
LSLDLCETIALSGSRRRPQYGNPFLLAYLAAFRLVLELLIVKEKLFPGGEDEITPAVDTLQYLVLKFH